MSSHEDRMYAYYLEKRFPELVCKLPSRPLRRQPLRACHTAAINTGKWLRANMSLLLAIATLFVALPEAIAAALQLIQTLRSP